jgi:CBS domain containing-hemolysin-like protein
MFEDHGLSAGILLVAGLLVTPLTLLLSALAERSGPIRLRHWTEGSGGTLESLYQSPRRFEAFRFLLSLFAYTLPAACALGLVLTAWAEQRLALLAGLAPVAVVVAASEYLSRWLITRDSEAALERFTWAFRLYGLVLLPAVAVLARLMPPAETVLPSDEVAEEASEGEIEAYLKVGTQEGILDPGEETLIQGIIDFGDTQVRSVMTPRIDMVCAPAEASLEELATLFLESQHSRIPLYRDSVDRIVGVLHIRELLRGLHSVEPLGAAALALPAFVVPGTKRLGALLGEFQARRQQMAIVVDEYGGTSGLVTVEDLLEEIVGEIADEHEEAEVPCVRLADGRWRIEGWADLDVLEELFEVDVEESPYETVGGLIFGLVGSVPVRGTVVRSHGLSFTVEGVEERRVQTVIAERPASEERVDG